MYSGLNSTHALYNISSRKKEKFLKGHANDSFLLEGRFVDASHFISGSENGKIHIWDLESNREISC